MALEEVVEVGPDGLATLVGRVGRLVVDGVGGVGGGRPVGVADLQGLAELLEVVGRADRAGVDLGHLGVDGDAVLLAGRAAVGGQAGPLVDGHVAVPDDGRPQEQGQPQPDAPGAEGGDLLAQDEPAEQEGGGQRVDHRRPGGGHVVDVAVLVGGAPVRVGRPGQPGVGHGHAAAVGRAGRPEHDADVQAGPEERPQQPDPGQLGVVVGQVVDGPGDQPERPHGHEQPAGDDHRSLPPWVEGAVIGAGRWC